MFKVGDWIYSKEFSELYKIHKIEGTHLITTCGDTFSLVYDLNLINLWNPKEGEWCWYNKQYFVQVLK